MPHWSLEEFKVAAPLVWPHIAHKFQDVVEDAKASSSQDCDDVVIPVASLASASDM